MKRTPYFMRGVLQGVGGFEIKNYRSFFILSPFILSAFPYHYPSHEVTYYSWGFKYHITTKERIRFSRFFVGIIFYLREVLLTLHYEKRLFEHASQPRVAGSDINASSG